MLEALAHASGRQAHAKLVVDPRRLHLTHRLAHIIVVTVGQANTEWEEV